MHNNEALELYRRTVAPNCKLVVAAMAANHASVVDPTDPRQLGCAGLDSNLPSIINNFISE
jgi:60 kDa SS-A/Ro ribonucleoprotein